MEPYGFGGVVVVNSEEFFAHAYGDSKLFPDFSNERRFEGLPRFHFAAREFPHARKVDIVRPLRDEDPPISPDDSRNDIHSHFRGYFKSSISRPTSTERPSLASG